MNLDPQQLMEILKELSESPQVDDFDLQTEKDVSQNYENNIKNYDSEKLCSLIASNRYLRFDDKMEVQAMQELSDRRSKGDNFPFEDKIKEYGSNFVPLTFTMPNLMELAEQFRKFR